MKWNEKLLGIYNIIKDTECSLLLTSWSCWSQKAFDFNFAAISSSYKNTILKKLLVKIRYWNTDINGSYKAHQIFQSFIW